MPTTAPDAHAEAEQQGARTLRRVALKDIARSQEFQVRRKLDAATVRRYANVLKSRSTMPPITLAEVDGALVLVDGWHRVAAHEALERWEIAAHVVPATAREAHWMAARANLTHGLPLKSAEVREVFRAYVRAGQHRDGKRFKSYREIALDLGGLKSHATLYNWMWKDFPDTARRMGGGEPAMNTGGLQDAAPIDALGESVRSSLRNAVASYRGVRDAETRMRLLREAEAAVEAMRRGESWEEVTSDF